MKFSAENEYCEFNVKIGKYVPIFVCLSVTCDWLVVF